MSDQNQKLFVGLAKVRDNNFGGKETNIGFQQKDLDLLSSKINAKGWVNLTLKTSKEGKPYLQIDTWVPKGQATSSAPVANNNEEAGDDLPF